MGRNYSGPTGGLSDAVGGFLDAYNAQKKLGLEKANVDTSKALQRIKAHEQAGVSGVPIFDRNGNLVEFKEDARNVDVISALLAKRHPEIFSVDGSAPVESPAQPVDNLLEQRKKDQESQNNLISSFLGEMDDKRNPVLPRQQQVQPSQPVQQSIVQPQKMPLMSQKSQDSIANGYDPNNFPLPRDLGSKLPKKLSSSSDFSPDYKLINALVDSYLKQQSSPNLFTQQVSDLPESIAAKALGYVDEYGEPQPSRLTQKDKASGLPFGAIQSFVGNTSREEIADKRLKVQEKIQEQLAKYRQDKINLDYKLGMLRASQAGNRANRIPAGPLNEINKARDAMSSMENIIGLVERGYATGEISPGFWLQAGRAVTDRMPIGGLAQSMLRMGHVITPKEQELFTLLSRDNITQTLRAAGTTFTDQFISRMANAVTRIDNIDNFRASTSAVMNEMANIISNRVDTHQKNATGNFGDLWGFSTPPTQSKQPIKPPQVKPKAQDQGSGLPPDKKARLEELRAKQRAGALGK